MFRRLLHEVPSSEPSPQSTTLLHLEVRSMHSMPFEHGHLSAGQGKALTRWQAINVASIKLNTIDSQLLVQKLYLRFILE